MKKDRQDTESCHGNDQKQQNIQNGRLHLHRSQERTLLVTPGGNPVELRRKCPPEFVADRLQVGSGPKLDLDRVHVGHAGGRVDHAPHLLQLFDRYKNKRRIVFAHLTLIEIDDRETATDRFGWRAGRGKGELHIVTGQNQEVVVALVPEYLRERVADNDPPSPARPLCRRSGPWPSAPTAARPPRYFRRPAAAS